MATQDHKASADCSRYNNINQIYFSDFNIRKHVDRVMYSCKKKIGLTLISTILEEVGFKRVSKLKLSEGKYLYVDTYEHGDDIATVQVFYGLKLDELPLPLLARYHSLPQLFFNIHDPNKELIDLISSSFADKGIELKVSEIELTFDFYTSSSKNRIVLFDFLKSHVFLRYSKSEPCEDKHISTYYCNQKRGANKGQIVYLKDDLDGKKIVRLELTLKRSILKKLEVDPSLSTIDTVNLFRYFSFMRLDEEKLVKHLKWKSKKNHKFDKNDKSSKNLIHGQSLDSHVDSWVDVLLHSSDSLMGKVLRLKSDYGVENFHRFLVPMESFTKKFIEETVHQAFLHSKTDLRQC